MIHWLNANKDSIAIVLSFMAVGVSFSTILIARNQSRLDTYARMHETLVGPAVASGRKELFLSYFGPHGFPRPDEARWDAINQALAHYDTLGTYYRRRLVPRSLLLDSWHHPLKAIAEPARAFAAWRAENNITQPWNGLDVLLASAERRVCGCDFCATHAARRRG